MTRFISILILIFALVACTDGPVNTTQESANDLQVQTSSEFASTTSTSDFFYVDWESANPSTGTASGTITLGDGSTVGVTFKVVSSDGSPGTFWGAQTSGGGINFWVPDTPHISSEVPNAPPDSDIIQLSGGNNDRYTITFSESVKDPIMPVHSLGQRGNTITYNFDREFEVVSSGLGYHGEGPFFVQPGSGNMVLVGEEGSGTIRFIGTFSTLSWTVPIPEVWHGITLGIRTTTAIEPDGPSNEDPNADAGADQTLEATGTTTSVTLDGSGSTDPDGDTLTYSWSADGSEIATGVNPTVSLGLGTHAITLTVDDGNGGEASDNVTVTVKDTTAPVLSFNKVTGILWPPNHKMVLVATGISAYDLVDGATDVTVTVTSSEAANGRGDGNTDSDYDIVTNLDGTIDVYVRSERSGRGNGRTYTINMSTVDNAGNGSSNSFEVKVAHNQGRGR